MISIPNNKVDLFNNIFWKKNQFDFLLINTNVNREWLTNFSASFGMILLSAKTNKPLFFLDERYFAEAKQKITHLEVKKLSEFASCWKELKGKVAVENKLNFGLFQQLQNWNPALKFVSFDLQELRMIKSEDEIINLRYICQLTHQVWEEVVFFVQKNSAKTEKEVELFIIQRFLAKGITEVSFAPIVSSGLRSAFIHTQPTDHIVQGHLLCDFGGKWKGYCSDFTRTIFFHEQKELDQHWKIVQDVHKQVIEQIKPGVALKQLALIAKKIFAQHNLKLQHALGHGIGLEVHESPNIWEQSDVILKPGMVFTIEPGIYLSNFGGMRYEDVVLVTENGCEILTS